ncbi:flagellar basal-body rod protein FlgF [Bosea caraganae]|uniref:Flagellar basal-body rod protein FlgF n=1 Tax=Bosea caraganae TaxID=2763117 RepID=A0A370LC26_9HYPH|nr:flagellar basal-body rod protein FlgF [Bosea caraganae]RDJ27422.1 flagellar basal-body rod protein FlgF [Bosea caraganae]RDJ29438.1 flagellar basal-body rod protein FlgF [Bosea caraganae]
MQPAIYVGLSAQLVLEKRLETVARNVANMNTAGYRAEEVKFDTFVSKKGSDPVNYASAGETFTSRTAGGFDKTGNPLDVAVEGQGFFGIQTPAGTVYTRDGRMKMTAQGQLTTLLDHPVLDAGGAPLQLDPEAGPPTIARDGMIWQGNQQVGAIGLFSIDPNAKLQRYENSGVIPDRPATAILDFVTDGVRQGYVEGSNVNPIREMTKLIMVTRAFDSAATAIDKGEKAVDGAIQALGANS